MTEIQITGVHYDVSDKLRAYINDKMSALARFAPDLTYVQVTIREGDKHGYRVDVDMRLPEAEVIAHEAQETVYAAVDLVIDKCSAQLRKLHDKRSNKRRSDRMERVRA